MLAGHETSPDQRGVLSASIVTATGWGLGILFLLNQMLAGDGFLLDDEITHFWRSHSVWYNPKLIFDAWTRPGRNLLHFAVAPLGLFWTRLFTCVLLGISVWLTVQCARKVGVKSAHWIPLLFFMQPWVVELGFCVLTQTPFLLVWIAAIYFDLDEKPAMAGFLFGYLPLVRHEGVALSACYALYCVWRGRWWGLVTLPMPLLAIDLAAYLTHQPLPTRVYTDVKPTERYGSGPLWHFVSPTIHSVGYIVGLLGIFSYRRVIQFYRQHPLFLTYPAYFALHSVIYWKGLFASGGYVFFLMPMAPVFAISAGFGIDKLRELLSAKATSRVIPIMVLLIVAQAWLLPHRVSTRQYIEPNETWGAAFNKMFRGYPVSKDSCKHALDDAQQWIESHPEASGYKVCCHPYFEMSMNLPETPLRLIYCYWHNLESIPDPVLFIWENKYAPYTNGRAREDFERLNWQEVHQFGDGSVIIYSNQQLLSRK